MSGGVKKDLKHYEMTPSMGNIVKTVSNVLFHGVDIFIWFGR
jgi:hypothetical protein